MGKGGLKGDPTAWHPSAPGLNGKARGQSPESRSPAGAAALGGGTWTTTATVWAELGHQTPRPPHPRISSLPPTGRSQLKPECKVFRDGQLLGAQSEARKVGEGLEAWAGDTRHRREPETRQGRKSGLRGSEERRGRENHRGSENRKRNLFQRGAGGSDP